MYTTPYYFWKMVYILFEKMIDKGIMCMVELF